MKHKYWNSTRLAVCTSACAMLFGGLGAALAQTAADRTVLPIREPEVPHSAFGGHHADEDC